MERAHSPAVSVCPVARSSEASLVAIALHANASPAEHIVSSAREWPIRRSPYGIRLARPRATSTIVIVACSEVWVWDTGGAHSPTHTTPTTIAVIARYS